MNWRPGPGCWASRIILLEFVLSGRFQTVSARIGMDVTMRFHQMVARTALVLVVLHPILYRAPFNPPYPWDVTRQFTLSDDIGSILTGILAWVLLLVLVALGIGRNRLPYRYETWRLIHGLGALLVAGLVLAHALEAGRYSQDAALFYVWIVLFFVAVFSLAYVYVIKPIQQTRRPWTVRGVRSAGMRTWELTLEPDGHRGVGYEAGQFVWLNVGNSPFSLFENPFSISSAPASGPALQFVIKELGDFTRTIGRIEPGARAYLDGPHGDLVVAGRGEPGMALVAGGVGIAPLIGILRQLCHENDTRPTMLIYGNRLEEQIAYREELATMAEAHGTEVVHVLSEPPDGWTGRTGLVDADLIRAVFDPATMKHWLFLLCGPPAMMQVVETTLIEMGVPSRQIESERFQYD